MKKLLTILTVIALSVGGLAQSGHPFIDRTGTLADQVTDAKSCITDPDNAYSAVHWLLLAKVKATGTNWTATNQSDLSNSVFADATVGGLVTGSAQQSDLRMTALHTQFTTYNSPADQLAAIANRRTQFSTDAAFTAWCDKSALAMQGQLAQWMVTISKDYAGAIAVANKPEVLGQPNDIGVWQAFQLCTFHISCEKGFTCLHYLSK